MEEHEENKLQSLYKEITSTISLYTIRHVCVYIYQRLCVSSLSICGVCVCVYAHTHSHTSLHIRFRTIISAYKQQLSNPSSELTKEGDCYHMGRKQQLTHTYTQTRLSTNCIINGRQFFLFVNICACTYTHTHTHNFLLFIKNKKKDK